MNRHGPGRRGDSDLERAKVEDLLCWPVDGLIVAPVQQTGDAGLFWELWRNGVPFVLIDRAIIFCSMFPLRVIWNSCIRELVAA